MFYIKCYRRKKKFLQCSQEEKDFTFLLFIQVLKIILELSQFEYIWNTLQEDLSTFSFDLITKSANGKKKILCFIGAWTWIYIFLCNFHDHYRKKFDRERNKRGKIPIIFLFSFNIWRHQMKHIFYKYCKYFKKSSRWHKIGHSFTW